MSNWYPSFRENDQGARRPGPPRGMVPTLDGIDEYTPDPKLSDRRPARGIRLQRTGSIAISEFCKLPLLDSENPLFDEDALSKDDDTDASPKDDDTDAATKRTTTPPSAHKNSTVHPFARVVPVGPETQGVWPHKLQGMQSRMKPKKREMGLLCCWKHPATTEEQHVQVSAKSLTGTL